MESLHARVQSLEGVADKRETTCTSLQEKLDNVNSDLQAKVRISDETYDNQAIGG